MFAFIQMLCLYYFLLFCNSSTMLIGQPEAKKLSGDIHRAKENSKLADEVCLEKMDNGIEWAIQNLRLDATLQLYM